MNNKVIHSKKVSLFSVLVFMLCFSSVGMLGLFAQINTEDELEFVVYPYLQDISDSSFCVLWETNIPVIGELLIAKAELDILRLSLKTAASEHSPVTLHKLEIEGLKPEELYYFQVINIGKNGDTLEAPVTQITIPNYRQSTISFTVVGDTQGNPKCWGRIGELMFKESPQFIVHCGDLVSYGPNKDDWTDEFLKPVNELLRHAPLYPTIGNHEMNNEKFYEYFSLPYGNAFYTVKKGDLRLIFVDTNKDILPGSERYKKLEKVLALTDETWKIVVHHHPIFTSDIASYRSSLMADRAKGDPNTFHLKNLYETYGVDLVLSGHVHGYERTWPISKNHIDKENGVVYIISGGGGGSFNPAPPYKDWFTATTKMNKHFLNIQINGNKLTVEAIDTSQNIFDVWEKEKSLMRKKLNAPLISIEPRYFIDSASVTIENTNKTGIINYRVNDGNYETSFLGENVLTLHRTSTIFALISNIDTESRETIKTAEKLPVFEKQKSTSKNIVADYYEGYFTLLPSFKDMKPTKTFTLDSLSLAGVQPRVKDHFAVRFKGSIYIPETNVYRFFLESFDGSKLIIDGKDIIRNDGVHYEISKEGYVALERGSHFIEVHYFDFERRETLNLKIGKQNGDMVSINKYLLNKTN